MNSSKSPEPAGDEFAHNGSKPEFDDGTQEGTEASGALDLTASSNFTPKAIKEEPGLPFTNGEYGKFIRCSVGILQVVILNCWI